MKVCSMCGIRIEDVYTSCSECRGKLIPEVEAISFKSDFPVGGEWDAGFTLNQPFRSSIIRRGRWTIKHTKVGFQVIFYDFDTKEETLLKAFPSSEEIAAKAYALALVSSSREN